MSSYLLSTSERAFVWYLRRTITKGKIVLRTPSHKYSICDAQSQGADGPIAELSVLEPAFFLRVLMSPGTADLVFAEAYMLGDVSFKSHEELIKLFKIFISNRDKPPFPIPSTFAALLTLPATLLSYPAGIIGRLVPNNVLTTARENISAHYDLGNDMFKVFLSSDMTYSCAIFPALDADLKMQKDASPPSRAPGAEDPLHDAQMRKLQHIIRKADVRPGHRVLEIGSGWGSLALAIARGVPDTVVDTITLSVEQAEHVRALVRADADASLEARIRVHLLDFRAMPEEWEGRFDRVVSVEMVEAIGADMYETYFAAIDWALKSDTGVGVVQGITIPEARYNAYAKSEDFINKHVIFPGGILPTVTHLTDAIVAGSSQRLLVESVENIGPHYARTLREWRQRFEAGFGAIEKALKAKYPGTMNDTQDGLQEVEMFRRKWIYYFCYCEAGFTTRTLGDHIITFTREGNVQYGCQVFI